MLGWIIRIDKGIIASIPVAKGVFDSRIFIECILCWFIKVSNYLPGLVGRCFSIRLCADRMYIIHIYVHWAWTIIRIDSFVYLFLRNEKHIEHIYRSVPLLLSAVLPLRRNTGRPTEAIRRRVHCATRESVCVYVLFESISSGRNINLCGRVSGLHRDNKNCGGCPPYGILRRRSILLWPLKSIGRNLTKPPRGFYTLYVCAVVDGWWISATVYSLF